MIWLPILLSLQLQAVAPQAAPRSSAAQQQALARNISGLIQPCARPLRASNPQERRLSVDLRVTVSRSGELERHEVVQTFGVDDATRPYLASVVDKALRALRACRAGFASLPQDQYAIPRGWRTFRYRFRFP